MTAPEAGKEAQPANGSAPAAAPDSNGAAVAAAGAAAKARTGSSGSLSGARVLSGTLSSRSLLSMSYGDLSRWGGGACGLLQTRASAQPPPLAARIP